MKSACVAGACAAAIVMANVIALAQGQSQSQPQPQSPQTQSPRPQSPAPGAAGGSQQGTGTQQVTVSGCIQRESDYRRAQDKGRGGVVGTGVGAGNEFVLINASTSSGAAQAGSTADARGTSGSTVAYELTGKNEADAMQYVGRRVEVSGMLKAADTTAGGRATGGPTAAVDVVGGDLRLRELEVTSIRAAASGTCPSAP
jgi:hypothetical protein